MQNLIEFSFLLTNTFGELQGLSDSSITRLANISLFSLFTFWTLAKGIFQGACLMGLLFPVSILCSAIFVSPISSEFFEKHPWYF